MNNRFIGDQESLRQINLSTALTHSRQSAPISCAVLAEITGLNWATITRLMREAGFQFLHADCLSILLQLNLDAGCIVVAEIKVDFGGGDEQGAILNNIARLVRQVCSKAREKDCHILGLAMSLPCLVDVSSGVLLFAPSMGWSIVALKQRLEKEFKFPIYINNKANMAALAESYFGSARDSEYVLYINITAGVGAGCPASSLIRCGCSTRHSVKPRSSVCQRTSLDACRRAMM